MTKIASINVGRPSMVRIGGSKPFRSSILKKPVTERVFLRYEGFENDSVGDPRLHGGLDKAVCVYCIDHFAHWEKELSRSLEVAAFGENLSVTGLDETQVCIGDVFQIGEAEVVCTQPRQPCFKLNRVFELKDMACKVKSAGFTGFYFGVVRQGWVAPGDEIKLRERVEPRFSVHDLNQIVLTKDRDPVKLQQAIALDALSDEWKKLLKKRLPS